MLFPGHLVSHRRTHTEAAEGSASGETQTEGEDCSTDCTKCDKIETEQPERKHDIRYSPITNLVINDKAASTIPSVVETACARRQTIL